MPLTKHVPSNGCNSTRILSSPSVSSIFRIQGFFLSRVASCFSSLHKAFNAASSSSMVALFPCQTSILMTDSSTYFVNRFSLSYSSGIQFDKSNLIWQFRRMIASSNAEQTHREVFLCKAFKGLYKHFYCPSWRYWMHSTCFKLSMKWSSSCRFLVPMSDAWHCAKMLRANVLMCTIFE